MLGSVGLSGVGLSSVCLSGVGLSSVGLSGVGLSSVGLSSVGLSGVGPSSAGHWHPARLLGISILVITASIPAAAFVYRKFVCRQ